MNNTYKIDSDNFFPVFGFLRAKYKDGGCFFEQVTTLEELTQSGPRIRSRSTMGDSITQLFRGGRINGYDNFVKVELKNQTYYYGQKSIFVIENNKIKFLMVRLIKMDLDVLLKEFTYSYDAIIKNPNSFIDLQSTFHDASSRRMLEFAGYQNGIYINPEVFTEAKYIILRNRFAKYRYYFEDPFLIQLMHVDFWEFMDIRNMEYTQKMPSNINNVQNFNSFVDSINSKLGENKESIEILDNIVETRFKVEQVSDTDELNKSVADIADTSLIQNDEFPEMFLSEDITEDFNEPDESDESNESNLYDELEQLFDDSASDAAEEINPADIIATSDHVENNLVSLHSGLEVVDPPIIYYLNNSDYEFVVAHETTEDGTLIAMIVIDIENVRDCVLLSRESRIESNSDVEIITVDTTIERDLLAAQIYSLIGEGYRIEGARIFRVATEGDPHGQELYPVSRGEGVMQYISHSGNISLYGLSDIPQYNIPQPDYNLYLGSNAAEAFSDAIRNEATINDSISAVQTGSVGNVQQLSDDEALRLFNEMNETPSENTGDNHE